MKVITIGRSEENDVIVNDPHASRHHLQIIQHDDGHYTLSDFGSTNGTYVNGQKISGEINLNLNDVVRIGNSTIRWKQYFEDSETVASVVSDAGIPYTPVIKERHGFVTFWLAFMLVCSIIGIAFMIPSYLKIYDGIDRIYYALVENLASVNLDKSVVVDFKDSAYLHTNIIVISSALSAICSIVFVILILKWKKIGFWCWAGANFIFGIISIIMMKLLEKDLLSILNSINSTVDLGLDPTVMLITIPIGILILWAILQIKKNGVSCWKLLE